jgi:hypothetical protein
MSILLEVNESLKQLQKLISSTIQDTNHSSIWNFTIDLLQEQENQGQTDLRNGQEVYNCQKCINKTNVLTALHNA